MASSQYPFSDQINESGVVKKCISLLNLAELSKHRRINRIWHNYIHQEFVRIDSAFMLKVNPFLSLINLYYAKDYGFILNIEKSTCRLDRTGDKDGMIKLLAGELPFLVTCNHQLSHFTDHIYFWSPDGHTFFQMQEENCATTFEGGERLTFVMDELNPAQTCQLRFDRCLTRKNPAVLLDASDEPIVTFEPCSPAVVMMMLNFMRQNSINVIPLTFCLKPLCLVSLPSSADLLVIAEHPDNFNRILKIKKNDHWLDFLCSYKISFEVDFLEYHFLPQDPSTYNSFIINLLQDEPPLMQGVELLSNGTKMPLEIMPVPEEMLDEMAFLNRGINPRFTPAMLLSPVAVSDSDAVDEDEPSSNHQAAPF